jgi:polar amino acid transport system substrate-binding protein/glutamine transport system substrate-binding protein
MKKIVATLTGMCLCVSLAGCGGSASTPETGDVSEPVTTSVENIQDSLNGVTIKVGTSGLFGPFSYYDTDGTTLIGYDLDLLNDLQEILGFEIDGGIQAMDYSALTTSIAEGKLDVGAAALCATDERKKVMNFSDTYCDSGLVVVINKNNEQGITGIDTLEGKTVAVEKGTASHLYAQKELGSSTIQVHDTITTAFESLEQQKVDAVLQDGPGAAFYIKTKDDTQLEIVGDEFNQGQSPYAIAYNKDFEYQEQFNAALKQLEDDGTIDALYEKWCK